MTQVDFTQARKSIRLGGKAAGRKFERIELRLLVALTFPLFLAVVALARLGFGKPRYAAVVSARPHSLLAEARQMAEATIASAFGG